jgi:hypothetical protein
MVDRTAPAELANTAWARTFSGAGSIELTHALRRGSAVARGVAAHPPAATPLAIAKRRCVNAVPERGV